MTFVNEPGLYSLVLGSRKPEAKAFKRWITHEVIPSIRRHGAYMTPATLEAMIADPDTTIRLLSTLKEEQERRKALEDQAKTNAPKVLFADAVATSHTSILVGELATGEEAVMVFTKDNILRVDVTKKDLLTIAHDVLWELKVPAEYRLQGLDDCPPAGGGGHLEPGEREVGPPAAPPDQQGAGEC